MAKRRKSPNRKKRKGGRHPVSFVHHPDTDLPVAGLRIHKSTGLYYRIESNNKSRRYYPKAGRVGLAYLRRAIYEHGCWCHGQDPADSVSIPVTEAHDDFGTPLPAVATFDAEGRPVNAVLIGKEDLAAFVREQSSNRATRKEFAESVGYPELVNLEALNAPPEPLSLQEIIDRYVQDKTFSRKQQATDARTIWTLFCESVGVDHFDNVTGDLLQRYKKVVERKYAIRTQKNHYGTVQGILNHAVAVFKPHRAALQELKLEIRLNCQSWSQDKKRKARKPNPKPMEVEHFRRLLAAAKKDSTIAYGLLLCGANFAMHGTEAADIRCGEFDLKRLELYSERTKTGVGRAAIIWRETAAAIRACLRDRDCVSDYLFVNADGERINIHKVNRMIRRLRMLAKLPDSVVFDGLRDMTRTAMGAENRTAIAYVMGHTLGDDDKYARREPAATRSALVKARKRILGKQTQSLFTLVQHRATTARRDEAEAHGPFLFLPLGPNTSSLDADLGAVKK